MTTTSKSVRRERTNTIIVGESLVVMLHGALVVHAAELGQPRSVSRRPPKPKTTAAAPVCGEDGCRDVKQRRALGKGARRSSRQGFGSGGHGPIPLLPSLGRPFPLMLHRCFPLVLVSPSSVNAGAT